MATTPLMPKATAVWLVENTALSFDQIADFCKLHPLEVKAIADGDAAQGIKGLDPVLTGQLTRDEIEKAEKDHDSRLHISDPKVRFSARGKTLFNPSRSVYMLLLRLMPRTAASTLSSTRAVPVA